MKKQVISVLIVFLAMFLLATSVFAGGGKVQGDKGSGSVNQKGPCPFGVETPPN